MVRRPYDEQDVHVRPGKGSRPRTKRRPAHADARTGLVVGVDRGRYTTVVDGCTVIAMKARELGRDRVVPGDRVDMVGDLTGKDGTLARIVRIGERRTMLRRTADDTDPTERIVVANADQLLIVTALANPEPRTRMIDRAVVAAFVAGMDAILVLTKADLADPEPFVRLYADTGVRCVITQREPDGTIRGFDEFVEVLAGKMSALVGHSGVGKSTLVNAVVPGARRAIGAVNQVTGRGRHTSTSAVALAAPHLAPDTWVIDTPGIRSFGLAHVQSEHLLAAFAELAQVASDECPRGCTHLTDSPDCALDGWAEQSPTRQARIDSLRRLLNSRFGADDPE